MILSERFLFFLMDEKEVVFISDSFSEFLEELFA